MKKKSVITEFFNTSNTADFLPKNGFNVDNLILAVADVFSGTYDRRHAPKKPRKLFQNDFVKMAKVEENLENILSRFSSLLYDLYIKTEGENNFAVDTHGEFVNLWDLCVQEGDGGFEIVTNWVNPDEIYLGIEDERGEMTFEKYPEAFRKIHFMEWRREELLNKRERLMKEYGDAYDEKAGQFTDFNWHYHPKKKTA